MPRKYISISMSTEANATLFGEFFAHCPELFFILDRQGAILALNDSLARLLGADAREGTPLLSFIHPDDQRAFDLALADPTAAIDVACRVRAQGGAYRAMSCAARRAPGSLALHGSLREVDPKVRENQVAANILRAVQDNTPVVIWGIDPKGIFFHHEGKGLEGVGLHPKQFNGMSIFELYASLPDELVKVRRALAGEVMHTIAESHETTWENWLMPYRDENGEVIGAAAIVFDLTEAKRAEKDLKEKLALIERQQQVIRALGTPIIEVWDRVLTLPLLGVVDSVRVAEVLDSLLNQVSQKGCRFAILDLTAVEVVDTSTAAHLLRLIQALRLLGAEGIITGIQPGVAQTMVMLGMNIEGTVTLRSLRDGLKFCMARMAADKSGSPRAG